MKAPPKRDLAHYRELRFTPTLARIVQEAAGAFGRRDCVVQLNCGDGANLLLLERHYARRGVAVEADRDLASLARAKQIEREPCFRDACRRDHG
jgi:hypothetical protein